MPVYDKPMIYYPLSTLMLAGIRDILVISTASDIDNFKALLKDGSQFGVNISYAVQPSPDGLAQAFIIGEDFIDGDRCAMVLGDNLFYGHGLVQRLQNARNNKGRATIFGYLVDDPERFGVVEFDKEMHVISLEEKPKEPKSNFAVTGLYFYDDRVVDMAKMVKPSARGELEITDLNKLYLEEGALDVQTLGRGFAWKDAGTMDSLLDAADFVRIVEKNQGIIISAPEEIAFNAGWIREEDLAKAVESYGDSMYGNYLRRVLSGFKL
jgi:glucose-1-phosphate thymidylyltransferase